MYHLESVGKYGIGVTGGLTAGLATDANVMVVTLEGGFLMNADQIETATRLGLGYTIVAFNDDGYGLLSGNQITPPANT